MALTLGRALYLGTGVGVVVASAAWISYRGVTKRLLVATGTMAIVIATLLVVVPHSTPSEAIDNVAQRFQSTFSDYSSTATVDTSTIAYRENVAHLDEQDLSENNAWVLGLGFISPTTHYDPNLPDGNIRDLDLGYFNAVMTMGLVGAALIFLPVIWSAWVFVRRRGVAFADQFLLYGSLAFCVFAVSASTSLAVLFSPSGVLVSSFVVALGLGAVGDRNPMANEAQ